jgi:hypothetical protein
MIFDTILNWLLYRVRDRDLVSVFYMWLSSFPNTICWRGYLFSNICFWCLCQNSEGCSCVGLLISGSFILLHWCFLFLCQTNKTILFLPLWLGSIIWSQIFWDFQLCSFCLGLLWHFRVFCTSKWILELIFFLFLWKMTL